MSASLVGSEMCIRDSIRTLPSRVPLSLTTLSGRLSRSGCAGSQSMAHWDARKPCLQRGR
eukprot:1982534-Alexandrium_andersonii.AAC.1